MELNYWGLIVGAATFVIIGVFHPIVIKAHYYFGLKSRWWFLAGGIVLSAIALLVRDLVFSILLGVVAFSMFWSVKEIKEQEKRVEKGWFPENPRRKNGGRKLNDNNK